MDMHEKVRLMREMRQWTQEEMAEKMNMSLSGYAKVERGETKLHLDKLQQIAQIFDIDVVELISANEKGLFFFMSGNSDCTTSTYYSGNESLMLENEKLKLIITHKEEMLAQKEKEIQILTEMLNLVKSNVGH